MDFKSELITPAFATQLLSGNRDNRRPDRIRVGRYAHEMKSGRWMKTHQPVAIAADGRVVDGQHRLMAIVESGISVEMTVAYNADPKTFGVVDQGKVRSGSDVFTIGGIKGPNISAIARLVYLYETDFNATTWNKTSNAVTSQMLLDWANQAGPQHPEVTIGAVLKRASVLETKFRKEVKKLGSAVGASLAIAEIYGGISCEQAFELVFQPIMSCIGLREGTPVYALHRVLSKRGDKRSDNAFQDHQPGHIDTNRARVSGLLQVIDDAFNGRERRNYHFAIGQPMKDIRA